MTKLDCGRLVGWREPITAGVRTGWLARDLFLNCNTVAAVPGHVAQLAIGELDRI
jgi:hypothetical protein